MSGDEVAYQKNSPERYGLTLVQSQLLTKMAATPTAPAVPATPSQPVIVAAMRRDE
jgi:hypothetical protein